MYCSSLRNKIYQVYYYLSILNRLSILFHGNFVIKVLDYFDFGNSIKLWVVHFKKVLKPVFYKMVLCPTF